MADHLLYISACTPMCISKSKGDGGCFENLQAQSSVWPKACREQCVEFALAEQGGDEKLPPCSCSSVLSFRRLLLQVTSTLNVAQALLISHSKSSGWLYALVSDKVISIRGNPSFC